MSETECKVVRMTSEQANSLTPCDTASPEIIRAYKLSIDAGHNCRFGPDAMRQVIVAWENQQRLIDSLTQQLAEAEKELKLWKPMTPEEAEKALAEVVAEPLSDEEINAIVERVTDPAYRPPEPEHVKLAAKVQQLTQQLAAKDADIKHLQAQIQAERAVKDFNAHSFADAERRAAEAEKVVQSARAMMEAWKAAQFGSNHHTVTGVLVAIRDYESALSSAERKGEHNEP